MPEKLTIHRDNTIKRRIVVGDIHGCFKTLKRLIENKINITLDDQIFFVGDYIDRGPLSSEVLKYIISLQKAGYMIYALRGNHEEVLLNSYTGTTFNYKTHLVYEPGNVGLFNSEGKIFPPLYVWLLELPYFIIVDTAIIVHAGVNFKHQDPFSDFDSMLWKRRRDYSSNELNEKRIFAGHIVHKLKDIEFALKNKTAYIPVDNGCVYANRGKDDVGSLVAVDMDTLQLYRQKCIDEPLR